jgi:hypothetical protein
MWTGLWSACMVGGACDSYGSTIQRWVKAAQGACTVGVFLSLVMLQLVSDPTR